MRAMTGPGPHLQKRKHKKIDVRSKMEGTSIFLIATRAAVTANPGAGLAAYFDAAGAEAGAAALASSAFLSFLACLTCFTFFSTAGLASGVGAGVLATAEADADATATGAEADAALAGAVGVVANALPIKTVEAIRAVMSLFMVIFLKLWSDVLVRFFYWQRMLPV